MNRKVEEILKDEDVSTDIKEVIRGLMAQKQEWQGDSSVIPDFHQMRVKANLQKKNGQEELIKKTQDLDHLITEVSNYLRTEYTKVFANATNSLSEKNVVANLISEYLIKNGKLIEGRSQSDTIKAVQEGILDYFQLNDYIFDENVQEIRYNGEKSPIKVVINGREEDTDRFMDADTAYLIAERMVRVSRNAKAIRKDNPITRINLNNNIRVTIITDPIARENNNNKRVVQMAIRKQPKEPFSKDFLLKNTINEYGYSILEAGAKHGLSIIVFGGTESGKTGTLRSILHHAIPNKKRGITIAEIDEMNLQKVDPQTGKVLNNVLMWELNESLMSLSKAVNSTLTMSPDFIVLQEMKGAEAADVGKAGLTGHQVMTSTHCDDIEELADRILDMEKEGGTDVKDSIILKKVPKTYDIAAHIIKMDDGSKRIIGIYGLTGYDTVNNKLKYITFTTYKITRTELIHPEKGRSYLKVQGHYEVKDFFTEKMLKKMAVTLTDEERLSLSKQYLDCVKKQENTEKEKKIG